MTSCGDDGGGPGDASPPTAVSDLAASALSDSSVELTWTAPGDDGLQGTSSQYDLRYSTSLLVTEGGWSAATRVLQLESPKESGEPESLTVVGLTAETNYNFALKTGDEIPNWSGLSNVASATTLEFVEGPDIVPPAAVSDLAVTAVTSSRVTLQWTTPGDDGWTGGAFLFDIRYSQFELSESQWSTADPVTNVPTPYPVGRLQDATVSGLASETDYYFGIKTRDEAANWSELSNVVQATTLPAHQAEPVLSDGSVNSASGSNETVFTYRVTYSDLDGDPPGMQDVVIDNTRNEMTRVSGNDTTGANYEFTTTLARGEHEYYFEFDDSFGHSVRLPVSGILLGPSIHLVRLTTDSVGDDQPSWSPDGSSIAFKSWRSGNEDIWVIPATGGTATQITVEPRYEEHPSWSPDGSQIAITAWADGDGDIWILPAAGGVATQVTTDVTHDEQHPCWSPDGSTIAFQSDSNGNSDIWVIPSSGGTAVQITNDPAWDVHPCWSPDGAKIAFTSDRSGVGQIWVVPAEGGAAVQITTEFTGAMDPAWSPDGEWIAFERSSSLWRIPAIGGSANRLTEISAGDPCWSPLGDRIAFMSTQSGKPNIWVIDVE